MDIEETGTVTKMAGNAEVVYFFNDKKIWLDEIMILLKDLCAGKMPAVIVSPPSWWQRRMDIEETGTVTKMAGNAEVVYFFNDKKIWLDEIMILLKDLCAGKMPAVIVSPPSWWQRRMDIEETGTVTKMAGNAEVVYFFNDKTIWLDQKKYFAERPLFRQDAGGTLMYIFKRCFYK
ncbi:MAG: hypothetical protein ACLFQ6_08395, partial [Candidatus Sumerlaeia bacterium]